MKIRHCPPDRSPLLRRCVSSVGGALTTAMLLVSVMGGCGAREEDGAGGAGRATMQDGRMLRGTDAPTDTVSRVLDIDASKRFDPLWSSPMELAQDFLAAVASRDVEALRRMLVDEQEFTGLLWPRFPSSDPALNIPVSFAWTNLAVKSDKGLRRVLRTFGGRALRLDSLSFEDAVERYHDVTVQGGTVLHCRADDGTPVDVRLAGSIVTINGGCKFLSYRE